MIVAIVFFVISLLLFALTITLFFVNDIVAVIGELSGRTAKKQIEQIRAQGVAVARHSSKSKPAGNKNTAFDNMLVNAQSRDTDPNLNVSEENSRLDTFNKMKTSSVSTENISKGSSASPLSENETSLLNQNDAETDMLTQDDVGTDILTYDDIGTEILSEGDIAQTTVLNPQEMSELKDTVESENSDFEIISDETFAIADKTVDI